MNDESAIQALRLDVEERERRHVKELRGLSMQVEWLRARCKREEGLRAAAAYVKRYMGLQIDLYQAWYVYQVPIPIITITMLFLGPPPVYPATVIANVGTSSQQQSRPRPLTERGRSAACQANRHPGEEAADAQGRGAHGAGHGPHAHRR